MATILALPRGLLPPKSLHLPSSPVCHLGLCLIAAPACLGRDGEQALLGKGQKRKAGGGGKRREGREREGAVPRAWLGEALCRPGT